MVIVHRVIDLSVRYRGWVVLLTLLAALVAARDVTTLRFDAFPDLTNVQVQVVTSAPGLGAEEAELLVTAPVERVLGGMPGLVTLRSLSRPGVSVVTAVFDDETDLWLARQLVRERLDTADIPDGVARPELGPPTTGLGEVWQFTLWSDRHTRPALYRIFERDVAPRLRTASGVVEVNAWGAGSPRLDVRVDPWALAARGLSLSTVLDAVRDQLGVVSGGSDDGGGDERRSVRGRANPVSAEAIADLGIAVHGGVPIRLGDVASIDEGGALTVGVGTADARGEALFGMVQLVAGGDARTTVAAVRDLAAEVQATLPDGVVLDPVYDREKLVGATLGTVERNLIEGGLLVVVVLLLTLGDLRAGLIVASVIPLAMLGALAGLARLGISGNLMSLGAIDFGLVVDGTVVVVEGIVALHVVAGVSRADAIAARTRAVAAPVLSSVGILLVVYLPILLMQGTEGKLFRPMAVTVLLALATALVLSFTYVPAMATLWIRPSGHEETWLLRLLSRPYAAVCAWAMRHPRALAVGAGLTVIASAFVATRLGVLFVPRLEEGDLVVQTERPPAITPEAAVREATRVEAVLVRFPEVLRVASRVGSPAVATDPMGMHEADVLVTLAPRDTWTTARDMEGLVSAMARALDEDAPGAALTFTQPIEMRFNELLEGIPSDVGVSVYGPDLGVLLALGRQIADRLATIEGAADVRAPSVQGIPVETVSADPHALARVGLSADAVLDLVQAVQVGHEVGRVQRGAYRDAVVVRLDTPSDTSLGDLPVMLPAGIAVPLSAVATLVVEDLPAAVRREDGSRRVIVQSNVRGRDLGAFVADARAAVSGVALPDGYRIGWAGKLEQLRAASQRTAITVPGVLLLVLAMLRATFGAFRPAWLISLNVPLAISGGVFALALRGLPISMSAVVGFIALFGIAVMNGIVLVTRMLERLQDEPVEAAVRRAAAERFRPVLMTATVAGLGFIPMAFATGVGAEVQKPLATVVIGGLVTSTLLTLVVLPAVAPWFLRPTAPDGSSRP